MVSAPCALCGTLARYAHFLDVLRRVPAPAHVGIFAESPVAAVRIERSEAKYELSKPLR